MEKISIWAREIEIGVQKTCSFEPASRVEAMHAMDRSHQSQEVLLPSEGIYKLLIEGNCRRISFDALRMINRTEIAAKSISTHRDALKMPTAFAREIVAKYTQQELAKLF